MKGRFYRYFSLLILISLILSLFAFSCHRKDRKQHEILVTHPFVNGNWTFEEEVLEMPFEITDTTATYRIEFDLVYDSVVNVLQEIPVTITLAAPDGMSTFVTSAFIFDPAINKTIISTGHGNECTITLVAFPKKQLNRKGQYRIKFYRKIAKYDNYGMNCLTMRVVPLNERELKQAKR